MLPLFVGTAVNVTLVPVQIVDDGLAEIETLAGRFGLTVMVIVLEDAGLPETQVALLVITQLIVFPFAKVASE